MEKPGDLRDRPADKISACLDQGPEIRRICQLDLWTVVSLLLLDYFLMPSYYVPLSSISVTSSRERVWECPLDQGKFQGTGPSMILYLSDAPL